MTNPRSGSTWLFDALRCHPAIYMHPRATLYQALGLRGRRYPLDLSDGPQAKLDIEVVPGQWVKIPEFLIMGGHEMVSQEQLKNSFSIEKCHPHFFNHDVQDFLSRVNTVERNSQIRFIYQVRDPKKSFISFLQYQLRNPAWNAHRKPADIVEHMCRIYCSILELAQKRPGLILDYDDILNNFYNTMVRVFWYLWPNYNQENNWFNLISLIAKMTDRKKRQPDNPLFLGDKREQNHHNEESEFDSFFFTYSDAIDRCYQYYRTIKQMQIIQNKNR